MDATDSFSLAPWLPTLVSQTVRLLRWQESNSRVFLPISAVWSPRWDSVNMDLRLNAKRRFVTVVFSHFVKFHYFFQLPTFSSSSSSFKFRRRYRTNWRIIPPPNGESENAHDRELKNTSNHSLLRLRDCLYKIHVLIVALQNVFIKGYSKVIWTSK